MTMLCVPDRILEAKTWHKQIRQLEEALINGLVQRCGHGSTGTQDLPQKTVKSLGLRKAMMIRTVNVQTWHREAFDPGKQPTWRNPDCKEPEE